FSEDIRPRRAADRSRDLPAPHASAATLRADGRRRLPLARSNQYSYRRTSRLRPNSSSENRRAGAPHRAAELRKTHRTTGAARRTENHRNGSMFGLYCPCSLKLLTSSYGCIAVRVPLEILTWQRAKDGRRTDSRATRSRLQAGRRLPLREVYKPAQIT